MKRNQKIIICILSIAISFSLILSNIQFAEVLFVEAASDSKMEMDFPDSDTESKKSLMVETGNVNEKETSVLTSPQNVRQTGAGIHYVELTWDAVIGAADYYTSYSDGVIWSEPERVWGIEEWINLLSPGKTYYVRVYAMDKYGKLSEPSEICEVVTAPDVSDMTAKVTAVTNNSISFKWTAVTGATSYKITSRYNNMILDKSVSSTCVTISDLKPDNWYGFNIAAYRTSSTGYIASQGNVQVAYTKTLGSDTSNSETPPVQTIRPTQQPINTEEPEYPVSPKPTERPEKPISTQRPINTEGPEYPVSPKPTEQPTKPIPTASPAQVVLPTQLSVVSSSVVNSNLEKEEKSQKNIKLPMIKQIQIKSSGKSEVKVVWKKLDEADGYQLQYAMDKKFKKKAKSKHVSSPKTSVMLKGLMKKKTYFVRIRAYKSVDGKKVYGKWKTGKKVNIKN